MITEEIAQTIYEHLYADEGINAYAILDGASVPGILDNFAKYRPGHECLFRGDLAPEVAQVAPYLVHLDPANDFTPWVVEKGWGQHWGIFALADAELAVMRRHFRTFLTVYDSTGKPMLFRYYDPRVLRVYLPTCNSQELKTVFGPVISFLLEAEDPETLLRFEQSDGTLKQEKKPLSPGK